VIWSRPLGTGHSAIVVDDGRLFTMYRAGNGRAKLGPWKGAEPCRHTACDTWQRLDRGTLNAALRIAAGVTEAAAAG